MINLFYKTFKYIQKRKFWDTESFHIKADSSARQLQISVSDPGPAPWEGALQASSSLCDLVIDKIEEEGANQIQCLPHHFMEFYSPPRVALPLRRTGFFARYSFDLMTGYDFLKFEDRARALRLYETHAPFFVMLSPPCTMFSKMQTLNLKKMQPQIRKQRFADANCMLDFAMHIADRQLRGNRFFCHEHPPGASSWRRASIAELANKPNVFLVSFDQCRTGLRTPSGLKPIQKRTVLMTNSREIHNIFSPLQCNCTEEHAVIQGSESGLQLSSWCQVYSPELVDHLADAVRLEWAQQSGTAALTPG